MDRFGRSVEARLLQLLGGTPSCPRTGTAATTSRISRGTSWRRKVPGSPTWRRTNGSPVCGSAGRERILEGIKETLERFGVRFDVYRSERELAEAGEIDEAIDRLRDAGYIYEDEGAVWFRSTAFGDDKDRRSSGRTACTRTSRPTART